MKKILIIYCNFGYRRVIRAVKEYMNFLFTKLSVLGYWAGQKKRKNKNK